MTIYIISLCIICVIIVLAYMQHPKFGAKATGDRLTRMLQADNYKDGVFQNKNHTPSITEGFTYWEVLKDFFFSNTSHTSPNKAIPSIQTDFSQLNYNLNQFIWFGHSSYLLILEGKTFLIDPVLSGSASPIASSIKAFQGSNNFSVEQLPAIDYLIISHDHFDHLDYETIVKLKAKVDTVICPLGVGAHFEKWGYSNNQLIEKNWHESASLTNNIDIHFTPARHFSGRTFKRNTTLWTSYVLKTPNLNVFIGGDSGYDTHFKEIGAKFGPFDWAIIENGQYNEKWRYIHTLPSEQVNVIQDLQANNVIAVHNSKFKLANHPWNEPLDKMKHNCDSANINLATPMIGEVLMLNDNNVSSFNWWE